MKNNLKLKVTLWYTGLLALMIAAVTAGILYFAEGYIVKEAKEELRDEVSDFVQELNKQQDTTSDFLRMRFYDDGVVLSIYDEYGNMLDGFHPDEFPMDTAFVEGVVRDIEQPANYWAVLDQSINVAGEPYWIRGIYALDLLEGMETKVLQFWIMLIPLLLLVIGYLGYRMIGHALTPIYNMTKMADDITKSNNLGLRLPHPVAEDELGYLTETFNYMLNHLEEMFQRETQFTSDAAHELRTPISVISSHCEYCLEELEMSEEVREELTVISKKAHGMSELVSQLLMIARAESGKYQPSFEDADLEIMTETVLDELEEKARSRKIQLGLRNQMKKNVVRCDMNLMMQVLTNLVDNAINYGREEGHVQITLENTKGGCMIRVRDDGIGIAPEEADKIWNRFYRVDASHSQVKGFGLGLFMVRWIVELHGGKIEVQSLPELGSIFSVYLPENPDKR